MTWSDYDLLDSCNEILPKKIKCEHVKGHQDRNVGDQELIIQAKLNVLMDKLASKPHSEPNVEIKEAIASSISIPEKILTRDAKQR